MHQAGGIVLRPSSSRRLFLGPQHRFKGGEAISDGNVQIVKLRLDEGLGCGGGPRSSNKHGTRRYKSASSSCRTCSQHSFTCRSGSSRCLWAGRRSKDGASSLLDVESRNHHIRGNACLRFQTSHN